LKFQKKLRRVLRKTLRRPWILFGNKGYIFVLSHMRSRSTLLSHILGSHPSIAGYAESRYSYYNFIDLLLLRHKIYELGEKSPVGRLALDKLLHDSLTISPDVAEDPKIKKIFLLRSPAETVKSIIHMGTTLQKVAWHTDQAAVFRYYNTRLNTLTQYACHPFSPGFFIHSADLIERTESVLESLSAWLELKDSLQSSYSIFKYTGSRKHGDPFANIKTGKILTEQSDYSSIVLDKNLLDEANYNFALACETMRKHCATTSC
jgi:hypothetical protein